MKVKIWIGHGKEENFRTWIENNSSVSKRGPIEREKYVSVTEIEVSSNIPSFLRAIVHCTGVLRISSERGDVFTVAGEMLFARIPTIGEGKALQEIAFQWVFFERNTFSEEEVEAMGGYDTIRALEIKGWVFLTKLPSGRLSISTSPQNEQGF